MKKFTLLLFMMALICGVTFAQTQDSPLELSTTEPNVYSGDTYYTYTAPSESNVYLTLDFGKNVNVTVSDENNQDLGKSSNENWTAFTFAIPQSKTVTIHVPDWSSEGGSFTATVEETTDDFEGGATCDDAVLVTEKSTYLNSHYDNTTYTSLAYAMYVPETSGSVKIFIDGYSSGKYISVGCDGEKVDLNALAQNDPVEGTYYPYTVEEGVTYILTLQNGGTSPYHIKVVPVDDSEGASCNNPFTSTNGTFTLPAAAGTYWYVYDLTKTDGFVTITSDANLGTGKAVFLTSCTSYAFSTSNGSISMRKRIGTDNEYEEPLSTVYFAVVKTEATAADEQITVTEEDLQPGDAKTYPKEIAADTEYSTSGFAGATYYKFTVPADFTSAMYANVNYTIDGVSSTSLILEDAETGAQIAYAYGEALKKPVENGKSYILTVNSSNPENVSFKLTYTEIPAGAEYITAIPASLGENTLMAGSTYYKYTPTKGCFLKVDTGDAWTTMSFPKGANSYESYEITADGTGYKIAAAEGQTYVFYLQNIAAEGTFTLSEIEVKAGEIETNPIQLENGVAADLPAEAFKTTYYGFTTTKRGILDLRTDMPYEYDYNTYQASSMQYKTANDSWYNWVNGSAEGYITTLPTEAGVTYYIKTFTLNDTQYKLTATEYAFDELPAIPVETGAKFDVPVKTNNNFKDWYYLNIPKAGTFKLYAEGKSYADFEVYSTSDLNTSVARTENLYEDDVCKITLTFHADAAGEYAVALTNCPGYNGEGLTFTVTFEGDVAEPGTTEDNPILLTSGEPTEVPAGVKKETYFKFETSKKGILDIRTNMPYQYDEATESSTAMYVMAPADGYYQWTNGSAEGFIVTTPCQIGETYMVKTQTLDETNYSLTATEYAFNELPAIPTENGAEWSLSVKPNSNYSNWYYLNIPSEGKFTLEATGKTYANMRLYSVDDLNTVVAESKVNSENSVYTTTLTFTASEAGEYVAAVPTCTGTNESDVVFTVSFNKGGSDAISNVNTAAGTHTEVYDMSGRKVAAGVRAAQLKRGAYIVKGSNGKAAKVMLGK